MTKYKYSRKTLSKSLDRISEYTKDIDLKFHILTVSSDLLAVKKEKMSEGQKQWEREYLMSMALKDKGISLAPKKPKVFSQTKTDKLNADMMGKIIKHQTAPKKSKENDEFQKAYEEAIKKQLTFQDGTLYSTPSSVEECKCDCDCHYNDREDKVCGRKLVDGKCDYCSKYCKNKLYNSPSNPRIEPDCPITATRYWLVRKEDISGVSGTGVVADMVKFPDGVCVLRWRTAGGSTAVYDSYESVLSIHGHDGRTSIEEVTK